MQRTDAKGIEAYRTTNKSPTLPDEDGNTYAEKRPITDSEGLARAYEQANGLFLYGDVLYISGTKSVKDIADDALLPLSRVTDTQRYKDAKAKLEALSFNPKLVVGHSLVGAVAQSLGEMLEIETRTYDSPAFAPGDTMKDLAREAAKAFSDFTAGVGGAFGGELAGQEGALVGEEIGKRFGNRSSNRVLDQLPKALQTKYTVRYKRPLDPVAGFESRARRTSLHF